MQQKLIILPAEDEMLARLMAGVSSNSYMKALYKKLTKNAGEERYSSGVVIMVSLAIEDFCRELGEEAGRAMKIIMYAQMDLLLGALIKDEATREEAMAFYTTAMSKRG